jgi:hypothetical protein
MNVNLGRTSVCPTNCVCGEPFVYPVIVDGIIPDIISCLSCLTVYEVDK